MSDSEIPLDDPASMSDSDISLTSDSESLDDPANPVLLDTPDSDDSLELDIIERERRRNETLQNIANLERQNLELKDQVYYQRMGQIKYKLSEVQGGRSQAYLHHLQLLQEKMKVGQDDIRTYPMKTLDNQRLLQSRPIVLIGPPNIGRHELRQRLMEDSSRFAAAVPHTSRTRMNYEVDGLDYHFISREQFESDTLYRKFVEYGEFENDYYGTSIEAIKAVVNFGKICMLRVRSETLQILRDVDLKPNRVFRAYQQLLNEINSLEREPQWVPAHWLKQT
ncbi:unnamed protein product [Euphydryas editha]|uniref:Guanylate kinase-like domain-containing protein n=1 Tax=Euphydryas editha TaxID=104508 RepID=A0AAU9TW77_EUPED|nr:unnamed protein product [Euphydryas editha]